MKRVNKLWSHIGGTKRENTQENKQEEQTIRTKRENNKEEQTGRTQKEHKKGAQQGIVKRENNKGRTNRENTNG